jgi:nitronate monooxygenase
MALAKASREARVRYLAFSLGPVGIRVSGITFVLRKWIRKSRLPDAIVIAHPRLAGGHPDAINLNDVNDTRFDLPRVLEETFALFKQLGIGREQIPLIPAGGIHNPTPVHDLFALGASAVQLGTPFAVTEESDAHANF